MSDSLTSEQIAEIAEKASERAIEKFALLLGIDVTDKAQNLARPIQPRIH